MVTANHRTSISGLAFPAMAVKDAAEISTTEGHWAAVTLMDVACQQPC
jgi:hypothetical protein